MQERVPIEAFTVQYLVAYQYYRSCFLLCTATFSDLPIENYCMLSCVADPDVYPGFRILIFLHLGFRNPDLGSRTNNKKGVKKRFVVYIFAAIHVIKMKIIKFFDQAKKKRSKELNFFTPKKLLLSSQKIWRVPYQGSRSRIRIQGSKKHRIQDPQPCCSAIKIRAFLILQN